MTVRARRLVAPPFLGDQNPAGPRPAAAVRDRYDPGVFTSNSMLKSMAFLSGLLSPQSPSNAPVPVAP
jgi:hypothetical protein